LFSRFIVGTGVETLIPRGPFLQRWREGANDVSDSRVVWLHLRRAKGRIVVWEKPLSINESVFAVLFSTQITFRSSSYSFPILHYLMVSKIIYYVARMVDSPRGEGNRYEKGMDTPLYFYQVQNYQPQKNHKV